MTSECQEKKNLLTGYINILMKSARCQCLAAGHTACMDINLEKENISQIVYEAVNHKAARQENKDKRVPKPRTGKRTKRRNLTADY